LIMLFSKFGTRKYFDCMLKEEHVRSERNHSDIWQACACG
jgi:hypothetical protein